MCGIAGVRRYGDTPITSEEVKILLCALERRGNHATGIAAMVNNEIKIVKAAVPAWTFIADTATNDFLDAFLPDASMVLLHTRFATVGNPEDNNNNHPMFLGKSAVVHNGGINNHVSVFENVLKVPRSCETDSDVFRGALDKEGITGKAIATMNKFYGSAAVAAFSQDDPDKLFLARSGSPLVYATTEDKLWWASEMQALYKAVRPWVKRHGLFSRFKAEGVSYHSMPDNTAYILSSADLDLKTEFKTCMHYTKPDYNMRATYYTKKNSFKAEKKARKAGVSLVKYTEKSAKCPAPKCTASCFIPFARAWSDYTCHKCGLSLAAIASYKPNEIMFT